MLLGGGLTKPLSDRVQVIAWPVVAVMTLDSHMLLYYVLLKTSYKTRFLYLAFLYSLSSVGLSVICLSVRLSLTYIVCLIECVVVNPVLLCSSGDCNFERPYTACGYSQGKDDHFDWEQANTKERPSPNPWMPTGQSSSSSSFSPLPLPIQTESP